MGALDPFQPATPPPAAAGSHGGANRIVSPAVTRDLIAHINDFLSWHDFPKTVAALAAERAEKRVTLESSVSQGLAGRDHRTNLRASMVRASITWWCACEQVVCVEACHCHCRAELGMQRTREMSAEWQCEQREQWWARMWRAEQEGEGGQSEGGAESGITTHAACAFCGVLKSTWHHATSCMQRVAPANKQWTWRAQK